MTRHCFVVFEVGGASYKEFTVPFTSDPPVGVFVALPVNSAAYTVQDLVSLKGQSCVILPLYSYGQNTPTTLLLHPIKCVSFKSFLQSIIISPPKGETLTLRRGLFPPLEGLLEVPGMVGLYVENRLLPRLRPRRSFWESNSSFPGTGR